jgi:hypothetical protein
MIVALEAEIRLWSRRLRRAYRQSRTQRIKALRRLRARRKMSRTRYQALRAGYKLYVQNIGLLKANNPVVYHSKNHDPAIQCENFDAVYTLRIIELTI